MTYTYLWIFFVFAFLGWCGEVVFAAVRERRFVNRGFLNGPLCPIYGLGVVAMDFFLRPFGDSPARAAGGVDASRLGAGIPGGLSFGKAVSSKVVGLF